MDLIQPFHKPLETQQPIIKSLMYRLAILLGGLVFVFPGWVNGYLALAETQEMADLVSGSDGEAWRGG